MRLHHDMNNTTAVYNSSTAFPLVYFVPYTSITILVSTIAVLLTIATYVGLKKMKQPAMILRLLAVSEAAMAIGALLSAIFRMTIRLKWRRQLAVIVLLPQLHLLLSIQCSFICYIIIAYDRLLALWRPLKYRTMNHK